MLEFRNVLHDPLMRVGIKVVVLGDRPAYPVRSEQGKTENQSAGNAVTPVGKHSSSHPVFERRGCGDGPDGRHDGLGGRPRGCDATDPRSLVKAPTQGRLEDFLIPVWVRNDLESRLVSNPGILQIDISGFTVVAPDRQSRDLCDGAPVFAATMATALMRMC